MRSSFALLHSEVEDSVFNFHKSSDIVAVWCAATDMASVVVTGDCKMSAMAMSESDKPAKVNCSAKTHGYGGSSRRRDAYRRLREQTEMGMG